MRISKSIIMSTTALLLLSTTPAFAGDAKMESLEARIERLEKVNAQLLKLLGAKDVTPTQDPIIKLRPSAVNQALPLNGTHAVTTGNANFIGTNAAVSYKVLDHAENVNKKQLLQLQARAAGEMQNKVTLGGSVTAISNYQSSNTDSKFGYLMRHPTSQNQIGKKVSEAVVHAAQLAVTANITDNITTYIELLYNPEQSFGQGTITALNRNQIQARKAYILYGNLDKSPIYATLGKMDTPFGLNDTVSPFTNSTNWHAFAGLAYGAQLGYYANGLHVRAMAIQGGSQFRAANANVRGTDVPSRVNNFAVDANYTFGIGGTSEIMAGASYEHGSPYCQSYPVTHFNPCQDTNPAYSLYGTAQLGRFSLLGEFATTTKEWPGSAVPIPTNPLSVFEATKTSSFTLGGKYEFESKLLGNGTDAISVEFSKFIAGDENAPWERQNQFVVGYSKAITPSFDLFGEFVHVDGFVPLNFLSGGNFPDGSTFSVRGAKTEVFLVGLQAGF